MTKGGQYTPINHLDPLVPLPIPTQHPIMHTFSLFGSLAIGIICLIPLQAKRAGREQISSRKKNISLHAVSKIFPGDGTMRRKWVK